MLWLHSLLLPDSRVATYAVQSVHVLHAFAAQPAPS